MNPIFQHGHVEQQLRDATIIPATPQQVAAQKRGLGDCVHRIAGPIGRALKWPCLKGNGTTDLKPGSPCDKLKNALNKITP
jgi:hypothetical protein